jgi:hypothetical protein
VPRVDSETSLGQSQVAVGSGVVGTLDFKLQYGDGENASEFFARG